MAHGERAAKTYKEVWSKRCKKVVYRTLNRFSKKYTVRWERRKAKQELRHE